MAEVRGFVAFVVVAIAIGVLWARIDEPSATHTTSVESTTTTTTTTTIVIVTTTSPTQLTAALCERTTDLLFDVASLGEEPGDGPIALLAAAYWSDVRDLLPRDQQTEVVAVVDYYGDYLAVAQPFDHDPSRIILEGDKERFEQLVTRPAPGLESSREYIEFLCATEVPDQPSMSASSFRNLENRLLGNR